MSFDPKHILRVLAGHEADVIVVGSIGGMLHGSPLMTDDVDVVPDLEIQSLRSLADALNELNARIMSPDAPGGSIEMEWTAGDLRKWIVDFRFLNLMTDYGQLDLIYRPAGTSGYRDLATAAETLTVDDFGIRVASLEDIIRSKQAVGRDRDLEQLPTLRMLLEVKRNRGG